MQRRVSSSLESDLLRSVQYFNEEHFAHQLGRLDDVDIIHVHNEPDWLGYVSKQIKPDIPVVFDAHDLFSVRLNEIPEEEKKCFDMCDAFVFPSIGYQKHACRTYPNIKDKPNIVIYSYVNGHLMVEQSMPSLGGIVYEGGLRVAQTELNAGVDKEHSYHDYRNFNQVFYDLTSAGIPVTVFTANNDALSHHGQSGAFLIPCVDYISLLQNMSRFDWGIAGSPLQDNMQWNTAMPHKLFEYIAAGIPVLTWGSNEIGNFVEKHKIGIALDHWMQIPEVIDKSEEYRKNVRFLQKNFCMEKNIDPLIKLYENIILLNK